MPQSVTVAQTKPIPTNHDLAALVAASMANTQAYLKEARLLLDNEAWPRAQSIATLALEEIGKAQLCITMISIPSQYRVDFPFWSTFRDHRAKLTFAYLILAIVGDEEPPASVTAMLEAILSAATADNDAKFRGLYVDYKDGVLRLPSDVSESTARAMVNRVAQAVEAIAPAYSLENLVGFMAAEGEDRQVIENLLKRWTTIAATDEDAFLSGLRADLHAMRTGTFNFLPDDANELPPQAPGGLDLTPRL